MVSVSACSSFSRMTRIASATVAVSGTAMYSLFIRPPAESSSNSSSSSTSVFSWASISPRMASDDDSAISASTSAASSGDISSTMSAARSASSDSRMDAWVLVSSTSDRVSAATSLSSDSKTASRSSWLNSSTMSARSAGWMDSSAFMSILRRRRRCGSGSMMLQNSHRMELGGIPAITRRTARGGTTPWHSRRKMLRMPTSTSSTLSSSWAFARFSSKVTSLTRTTLRPLASMICWSRRSLTIRSIQTSSW